MAELNPLRTAQARAKRPIMSRYTALHMRFRREPAQEAVKLDAFPPLATAQHIPRPDFLRPQPLHMVVWPTRTTTSTPLWRTRQEAQARNAEFQWTTICYESEIRS